MTQKIIAYVQCPDIRRILDHRFHGSIIFSSDFAQQRQIPFPLIILHTEATRRQAAAQIRGCRTTHPSSLIVLVGKTVSLEMLREALNIQARGYFLLPEETERLTTFSCKVLAAVNDTTGTSYRSTDCPGSSITMYSERNPDHSPCIVTYKAIVLIQKNLKTVIPLEELAAACHMSVPTFHRRFKLEQGVTPAAYLRNLRIQAAKYLLATTHLSVAQITDQVGYSSTAHFCQLFRRCTGLTPVAFRKQHTSEPKRRRPASNPQNDAIMAFRKTGPTPVRSNGSDPGAS